MNRYLCKGEFFGDKIRALLPVITQFIDLFNQQQIRLGHTRWEI
jgi:hypothetical protein